MKMGQAVLTVANRRTFLKGAGLAGFGLASVAVIGSKFGTNDRKWKPLPSATLTF